jgi:hypothetical protein
MKGDTHSSSNDDKKDLPWFTDIDITRYKQEKDYLKRHREKFINAKTLWFNPRVLDKYRKHKYCILDVANPFSCILIFLDHDSTTIITSISFAIHGNNNIIAINTDQYLNLPPKERRYWQKYIVMDRSESYK